MPLLDYLLAVLPTALFYTAVILFIRIVLGHYGTLYQTVAAVLLACTPFPFLYYNWGLFVLVLLERAIRETIQILVPLERAVREAIRVLETPLPA